MFQVTPNTENFQARYIITHPASGDFSCEAGKKYLKELKERRHDEMEMLTYLTGKDFSDWDVVTNSEEERYVPTDASYSDIAGALKVQKKDNGLLIATLGIIGLAALIGFKQKRKS
jgi:hypothetical protein